LYGFSSPVIFFNENEIVDIFLQNGYEVLIDFPTEEFWPDSYYKKIPNEMRIRETKNFIFKKL
tara:strand:- start:218 stop:406 length:189 start_codon:yes stop_codon:yes gene_type:complete